MTRRIFLNFIIFLPFFSKKANAKLLVQDANMPVEFAWGTLNEV